MISPLKRAIETGDALGIKPANRILIAHISTQTMQYFVDGKLQRSVVISTSSRPPSNEKNSLGTPSGLHQIAERIGGEQPVGMVFQGRIPTGRHYREYSDEENAAQNFVTTRILWLRGLQPGFNAEGNVDSYERYIYIHGTNHPDRLGSPQSAGCLLVGDLELIALYEDVRVGDWVWIEV